MERIGVADFKSKLSEHLRHVRGGEDLVFCDRDTPIARVTAFDGADDRVPVEAATQPLSAYVRPALRDAVACDIVDTLAATRSERG
jgi:antitoxin (DNA-binding transcriptional repressor) of toxin-antitoxin stability system